MTPEVQMAAKQRRTPTVVAVPPETPSFSTRGYLPPPEVPPTILVDQHPVYDELMRERHEAQVDAARAALATRQQLMNRLAMDNNLPMLSAEAARTITSHRRRRGRK